ncbi:MAG TPA: cation:proton antiporter regulatory subunit [Mycobacteriales bacterium]|nr:cation:proton antiporter regulatory subunit [Mycobacteriales bacterium]
MDIEETRLPGIGLRHDFVTRQGRRIGVISQKNGARELFMYDPDDPDSCRAVIDLTPEESEVVAELLGAPRVIERLARLSEQVEGITTEGIPVTADSPFTGRTLADAQIRTRTGASIVAVIRGDQVVPSPGPDFRFQIGDKVVVVGTEEGVHEAAKILGGG